MTHEREPEPPFAGLATLGNIFARTEQSDTGLNDCIDEIVYDIDRPSPTESATKFIAQCTAIVVCLCGMAAAILGVIAIGFQIF